MTNKIDTVLKAITDRMARALPSDTVRNLKLKSSLVFSAHSYPTDDPQCSTRIHGSINTIIIDPKRKKERRRKHVLITFTYIIKEITFKTPYKDPETSESSSEGHDLLSSRIILSEDDHNRGCRRPSDLEDQFYRDTSKLVPEYANG
nr:hypothetical protein [Tanacetum cinerariifolium]